MAAIMATSGPPSPVSGTSDPESGDQQALESPQDDSEKEPEESNDDKLFDALRKNKLDCAKELIRNAGVSVNQTNSNVSPLYIAMDNLNMSMVKLLLDSDADVNLISYCNVFCSYETPIVTAARLQHGEFLDLLLDRGCDLKGSSLTRDGKTALQWAATHGNILMADILIKHGANVNCVGMYHHTALHYATLGEKSEMCKWLLDHGAEITLNGDNRSPLHIAAIRGNCEIVKALMEKNCMLNILDNTNRAPLSLACFQGHINVVKYMIEHCPQDMKLDLNAGLHNAAESGHLNLIKYLLSNGADINSVNSVGETSLAVAAKKHYQTVLILVEYGAKISVVDNRGYTSLQHALMRDQRDIAATLIHHGSLLHTYSPLSESPLQMAFNMSNPILVKNILQAGCHMTREAWFNPLLVREKIQEADFQVPRHLRLHPESSRQKDVWEWVYDTFDRTRSLKQLTRIVVREQLIVATDGISILPSINKLPLPQSIKTYLTLSDISNEY